MSWHATCNRQLWRVGQHIMFCHGIVFFNKGSGQTERMICKLLSRASFLHSCWQMFSKMDLIWFFSIKFMWLALLAILSITRPYPQAKWKLNSTKFNVEYHTPSPISKLLGTVCICSQTEPTDPVRTVWCRKATVVLMMHQHRWVTNLTYNALVHHANHFRILHAFMQP